MFQIACWLLLPFLTATASPRGGLDIEVRQEWERIVFGAEIGSAGLKAVDLEGDGIPEIVAAASDTGILPCNYWYIVQWVGNRYEVVYTAPPLNGGITSIGVANVDAAADLDVIVGQGNAIRVYNGTSRALIRTIPTGASSIRSLRTADVDADGQLEFVFCDDDELFIHNSITGQQEARVAGRGGLDLDVANVDGDAALEIAICNGSAAGYIVDGITRADQWAYPISGYCKLVCLGDVDGDGQVELITAFQPPALGAIRVFDIPTQSLRYSIAPSMTSLSALKLFDFDGDGSQEIAVGGNAGHSSIKVYSDAGASAAFLWQAQVIEEVGGVSNIAIGDLDGDEVKEIFWGSGAGSTERDNLQVASCEDTHAVEWYSRDVNGPFYAVDCADLDHDGDKELLSGCFSTDSGSEDGLYFIHDSGTHEVIYTSPRPTGNDAIGLWRIRHANIDADAQDEIFITTAEIYEGQIICYDSLTHAEQWVRAVTDGEGIDALEIADVDGDGQMEVIAATHRETTGASGAHLYVFDAATGAWEWNSVPLGTTWAALPLLRIANTDSDAALEMIVAETGGAFWVFDGATHNYEGQSVDLNITSLDTIDLDRNGIDELIVGNASGQINVVNPANGAVTTFLGAVSGQIKGLRIVDLMPGDPFEMLFVANGVAYIAPIGGPILANLLWSSEYLGPDAGAHDSIFVDDIDLDGRTELYINLGPRGFRIYEVNVPIPGDANCDGAFDVADTSAFATHLIDPEEYEETYPSCEPLRSDMNGDSQVDGADIASFVETLLSP